MRNFNWFIHLDDFGRVGCGSERNRPCYHKRRPAQMEIARMIQKENNGGSVYLFPNASWTQKVCEMDSVQMGKYVQTHGVRLV